MPTYINNDTVNNITYLNYFTSSSSGELTTSGTRLTSALTTRGWSVSGVFMIPNSTKEPKINTTASSGNYRLTASTLGSSNTSGTNVLNSNNSDGANNALHIVNIGTTNLPGPINNILEYGIITNDLLIYAGFGTTNGSMNTATYHFKVAGWLADSSYQGSQITKSLCQIAQTSTGVSDIWTPLNVNTSSKLSLATSGVANYNIACASDAGFGTTPGSDLWTTDLWVMTTESVLVGRVPHCLLAKGTSFSLGNLYYINSTIDGVTDQKIWLCAAPLGTDKILMRVFSEGLV